MPGSRTYKLLAQYFDQLFTFPLEWRVRRVSAISDNCEPLARKRRVEFAPLKRTYSCPGENRCALAAPSRTPAT